MNTGTVAALLFSVFGLLLGLALHDHDGPYVAVEAPVPVSEEQVATLIDELQDLIDRIERGVGVSESEVSRTLESLRGVSESIDVLVNNLNKRVNEEGLDSLIDGIQQILLLLEQELVVVNHSVNALYVSLYVIVALVVLMTIRGELKERRRDRDNKRQMRVIIGLATIIAGMSELDAQHREKIDETINKFEEEEKKSKRKWTSHSKRLKVLIEKLQKKDKGEE